MAIIFSDRVKDTTTTTGTGTITLSGTAPTGFQAFATAFVAGDTIPYCIEDTTNGAWEVGFGVLATGTTIARDIILKSSNSNNAVNFSAGTKTVFCTLMADVLDTHGQLYATSAGVINL